MKGEYVWKTGTAFDEMRLLLEGAVALFEEDAVPLNRLALEQEDKAAAIAFDTIGAALYALRDHLRELQDVHIAEVLRAAEL